MSRSYSSRSRDTIRAVARVMARYDAKLLLSGATGAPRGARCLSRDGVIHSPACQAPRGGSHI